MKGFLAYDGSSLTDNKEIKDVAKIMAEDAQKRVENAENILKILEE